MILIADCGSTKIDWCLIDGANSAPVHRFESVGMNAVMLSSDEMKHRMESEAVPCLKDWSAKIGRVYFYGAGCISPEVCGNVAESLALIAPKAEIEVHTDLLAAARALCGHHSGIACIMGTGSNSCYYDGEKIVDNVSPLGFILGDEGSGAVLGKLLVGDVLKHQLPEDLCEKFLRQYKLDRLEIINRVYRQPQPNRFLASLSPFLAENLEREEVRKLVRRAFDAFFQRNIAWYGKCRELEDRKVHFVGSIAYHYKALLAEAAEAAGFEMGTVLKSPMDGLIEYHTKKI